ncbi:hypothetical protein DL98DRAFT_116052 [Cadophora sp. DSE1049]|nr:hypothetical protein DL98DRAFT_116052 [Cadophora sp. DSE1049]
MDHPLSVSVAEDKSTFLAPTNFHLFPHILPVIGAQLLPINLFNKMVCDTKQNLTLGSSLPLFPIAHHTINRRGISLEKLHRQMIGLCLFQSLAYGAASLFDISISSLRQCRLPLPAAESSLIPLHQPPLFHTTKTATSSSACSMN